MKTEFEIPTRDDISPENQIIFDALQKSIGFVPNLYAAFAHSQTGLSTFLTAQNAKSSLSSKEKEAVSLVVSQVNHCAYCLSAHTVFAKKNGFSDPEILEIRSGRASFNSRLEALVKLAKSIVENKGNADPLLVEQFYVAGYNKGNLIDLILLVCIRSITNYIYAISNLAIDWPQVPKLQEPATIG